MRRCPAAVPPCAVEGVPHFWSFPLKGMETCLWCGKLKVLDDRDRGLISIATAMERLGIDLADLDTVSDDGAAAAAGRVGGLRSGSGATAPSPRTPR